MRDLQTRKTRDNCPGGHRDDHAPNRWDRLPRCESACKKYRIQVRTERIGYINAILESYDEIGRIQTEDARKGILVITVAEGWDDLFRGVMADIARAEKVRFLEN